MTTAFDSEPAKKWPQSVIAIGAKDPQQLAQKWLQKLVISQDKLAEAGWIRLPDQDLADNLKQLKTALESFAEQSIMRGGISNVYPANVAALNTTANSEDPDFSYTGQYSMDWKNSVSKEQGIGKAFADYQSFKNSKDRSAFKGSVLYEPVGKPVYSKESKQNLVSGYKLLAYTEDGYILELKSDGTVTKPKRLGERPWRWNTQPVESYQGSAIYGLQSNPHLVKISQDSGMQPSMSYFKNYLLLGANPDAIKQTIDHLQQSKTALDKDPRFQAAFQRLNQDTQNGLFYFDLQSVIKKLKSESPDLPEAEQEATKEWEPLIQPLQHFSGNSNYSAKGQGVKFQLGIDRDQVDFQKISEALGTGVSAMPSSDRARISSVKANMHTLQTIAETYAVDWGGIIPIILNKCTKKQLIQTIARIGKISRIHLQATLASAVAVL